MSSQIPEESAPVIAVFYAGNSLMHQVSNWAIRHPNYDFALSFAQSLREIRSALLPAEVAILDATEDPGLAMTAFTQAITALEADCVAVYTETMHEGLEPFVRVSGVLLLWGPIGDAPWESQLERMLQSAGRMHPVGCLAGRSVETGSGLLKGWLRKYRLQTFLTKRSHEFFQKGR
jgi:hypothetical protein